MKLTALLILAAAAVPAVAQEPTPAPSPRPKPRMSSDSVGYGFGYGYGPEGRVFSLTMMRRGRLGISVDLSADPATDTIGAKVGGVTPGGPADKAGVRAGDIVVTFNGKRLTAAETGRARGRSRENRDSTMDFVIVTPSRPGTRLIEMAARLDTGDTVQLELRRDGQPVHATVIAGESGLEDFARRFQVEPMPGRAQTRLQIPGGEMFFDMPGAPLADLELVKVNPGLADYFGTAEGLLVVNVPRDSSLGLRSGDVILTIGGRQPGSPSHAMRILGTYDPNESVVFEVMRMKRHATVNGKMPARRGWRVMPNSFDFDMPDDVQPFLKGMDQWLPDSQGLLELMPKLWTTPAARQRTIKATVET